MTPTDRAALADRLDADADWHERSLLGRMNYTAEAKHTASLEREAASALRAYDDMYDELRKIAVIIGRTKDGTGEDEDWFELSDDVAALRARVGRSWG